MAAVQGIVLTAVAAGVLPGRVAVLALVVVAALLAESFGREAWGLWRATASGPTTRSGERGRVGPWLTAWRDAAPRRGAACWRRLLTVLAVLVVWAALVASRTGSSASPRWPSCASRSRRSCSSGSPLLLPPRRIRVVAAVVGVVLGLLAVVRILDLGFHEALHRPFNPVNDWRC